MGHRGDSFLKIYILGIFGDVSSNIILDRCRKPPKKYFDSQGDQGGRVIGGTARGPVFFKSAFLVFLAIFL